MNEIIFIGHTLFIAIVVLFASRFGKEALLTLSSILWLLANLFVTKQIELFGFNVTSSDAFIIGGSLCIALLSDNYGHQFAKKGVFICFGIQIFFAALSFIHRSYIPSVYDSTHDHFNAIFSSTPRIIFASIFAYISSQFINISLVSLFKKWSQQRFFEVRTTAALILSQAVDTLIFAFVGLFGLVSELVSIMLISFLIKTIAIFLTAPLLTFVKKSHDPLSL